MTVRIINADCRAAMAQLEPESVDCVVTSPPYYGLRDYGIAPTVWGGLPDCSHDWGDSVRVHKGGFTGNGFIDNGRKAHGERDAMRDYDAGQLCGQCGAWRGVLGLEPSVALYLEHIVEVFDAVARVLKPSGTLWLNMGDSYAGSWGASSKRDTRQLEQATIRNHPKHARSRTATRADGLKPKDLMLMPSRVALALQDSGWFVRSEIVWHKRAPMPESAKDRPTQAHEKIFLLTRSARYFYDTGASAEPRVTEGAHDATGQGYDAPGQTAQRGNRHMMAGEPVTGGAKPRRKDGQRPRPIDGNGAFDNRVESWQDSYVPTVRNMRNVWTLSPAPYPGAHFATFPPELPRRCIVAGCPPGGTVLDPFAGHGTAGLVADRLGRNAIMIEAGPENCAAIAERIAGDAPLFAEVEPVALDLDGEQMDFTEDLNGV